LAGSLSLTNNGQAIASGYTGTSTQSSLNTAIGNFTIIGSGNLGALSNGGAGSYDYITKAKYDFSLTGGNDLFLNFSDLTQSGTGFDSATLKVTENGGSVLSKTFGSFSDFVSYIASPTDLGAVSGPTSVDVSLAEVLSGLGNGQQSAYQLAIVSSGTVTGQFHTASAVPLPKSLALFATALLGLAGYGSFRRRKKAHL
jgi:hypothetical protein